MFFEGNDRIYLAGPAWLLGEHSDARPDMEQASAEWATAHMIPNEANSYILGQFVEADKANNNKQFFRLGDLLMAQPTIAYAPVNINHQSSPVGAFIASEMQYPKENGNPYIDALSAIWKVYFPTAYEKVQRAYSEGNLYYSMEAVPRTLSTIGGTDDTIEYAYEGRTSKNYPEEINKRTCDGIVLNRPHFVGGALIVPPVKPGWSKADVKQMSHFMQKQWETAEEIYSGAAQMAPESGPEVWEAIMGELILMGLQNAAVLKTKTRNQLPSNAFAIPSERKYPIHDLAHARNALARVSANGTPEEKKKVRSAVYKKYPKLKKSEQ